MSLTKKQYFAYEEAKLHPTDVIITGNYKRHTTTLAAKWSWIDSLTDQERQQLADEFENETKNKTNDW